MNRILEMQKLASELNQVTNTDNLLPFTRYVNIQKDKALVDELIAKRIEAGLLNPGWFQESVRKRMRDLFKEHTTYSIGKGYDPLESVVLRLQDEGHLAKSKPRNNQ